MRVVGAGYWWGESTVREFGWTVIDSNGIRKALVVLEWQYKTMEWGTT